MTDPKRLGIILAGGTDPATRELLREWLMAEGWRVVEEDGDDGARDGALVVVDEAFPRQGPSPVLQRAARRHAGTPVLMLSATFHSSIECSGDVARSLGVAGVLPKQVRRDALLSAVQHLSRASP